MIAAALYLVAPAVLAGAVHAVVLRRDLLASLARPLSCRAFGANKTWRGVVVMTGATTAGLALQTALARLGVSPPALVDYAAGTTIALGPVLGLAYSLAELPNSFVKRRLAIPPGHVTPGRARVQYLADQGDSVAGVTLALIPFVRSALELATVFALGFLLHGAFDVVLHRTGVKGRRELRPS